VIKGKKFISSVEMERSIGIFNQEDSQKSISSEKYIK